MKVIGQAHTLVHQGGVLRVQTDIRAGTRFVFLLPKSSLSLSGFGLYTLPGRETEAAWSKML